MRKCRSCKFWFNRTKINDQTVSVMGDCLLNLNLDMKLSANESMFIKAENEDGPTEIVVGLGMITGESFGCVHHEKR